MLRSSCSRTAVCDLLSFVAMITWLLITGNLLRISACEYFEFSSLLLGTWAIRSSGAGLANGLNLGFCVFESPWPVWSIPEEPPCGLDTGFFANAGQYRSWNWTHCQNGDGQNLWVVWQGRGPTGIPVWVLTIASDVSEKTMSLFL